MAFETGGGDIEVIWVVHFARLETGFTGILANRPVHLESEVGDLVTFDQDAIRDWMVVGTNDRMYGAFTTRAMVSKMSPEAAAQTMGYLSDTPLPSNW